MAQAEGVAAQQMEKAEQAKQFDKQTNKQTRKQTNKLDKKEAWQLKEWKEPWSETYLSSTLE